METCLEIKKQKLKLPERNSASVHWVEIFLALFIIGIVMVLSDWFFSFSWTDLFFGRI